MTTRRGTGDGGLYKRADGRWEGSIDLGYGLDGKRKRKRVYSRTRAEALDKLRRAQLARAEGLPALDERTRVDKFLDQWLTDVVRPRRTYGHWRNCESNVRLHINPVIGRVRLARLTAADVERLVNVTRAKNVADDTVRLVHATLRAALTVAKRWGLVHENVATLVEPITVHRAEIQPFTEEETARLLAEARDDRLGAFVMVALALGLRPAEARALAWDNVDLDGTVPYLRVQHAFRRAPDGESLGVPKTDRSRRTVVLPDQCIAALRRRRRVQRAERLRAGAEWSESGLVFTGELGHPLSSSAVSRWFAKLAERADVSGHRLYDCRHTAATLLLAQGVHPRVVMEVLGHSTFRLTMDTYAHVMLPTMREAADATERALERISAAERS